MSIMTSAELPEVCYGVHITDKTVVLYKRGERGYYPTDFPTSESVTAEMLVKTMNERMGITPAQAKAMEFGSIAGFDTPGADPKTWEGRA